MSIISNRTVALFGESEKGDYKFPHYCKTLGQLMDRLGHPSPESRGIYYAVQAILYENHLIYFRVEEEGFSHEDYLYGVRVIEKADFENPLTALFAPGVGSCRIVDALASACKATNSVLVTTEEDLYDYLMRK